MDGMWEGVSRARGHEYVYGSFAWMYDKSNRYCKAVIISLPSNAWAPEPVLVERGSKRGLCVFSKAHFTCVQEGDG